MNVPNPNYSVFASRNEILAIACKAKRFIKMSIYSSIMLFSLEYDLLLALNVPLNDRAVL